MRLCCVSARIPKELLEKLKAVVEQEGYANISDYIRAALREKLIKD